MQFYKLVQRLCLVASNSVSESEILTKNVVGANANPPKKLRRPPKNGKHIPTNIVNAAMAED